MLTDPRPALDGPAFVRRLATPHAVPLVATERKCKAFSPNRTALADLSCDLELREGTAPFTVREEEIWVLDA